MTAIGDEGRISVREEEGTRNKGDDRRRSLRRTEFVAISWHFLVVPGIPREWE